MFKELSTVMGLLKNQGKIQEGFKRFQDQVATITAEATAGAGHVTAKVNGKFEILSVRISEEAMKLNDREMLEDLIAAATNQAMTKVRQQLSIETAKMAESLGVPPAMLGGGLPGIG